ncbi:hypothetical protein CBS101457_000795 [Exobasidium rhododendri]|nr:hypothetical protein CBS101457_000795 [Exobasidium rhododendri]
MQAVDRGQSRGSTSVMTPELMAEIVARAVRTTARRSGVDVNDDLVSEIVEAVRDIYPLHFGDENPESSSDEEGEIQTTEKRKADPKEGAEKQSGKKKARKEMTVSTFGKRIPVSITPSSEEFKAEKSRSATQRRDAMQRQSTDSGNNADWNVIWQEDCLSATLSLMRLCTRGSANPMAIVQRIVAAFKKSAYEKRIFHVRPQKETGKGKEDDNMRHLQVLAKSMKVAAQRSNFVIVLQSMALEIEFRTMCRQYKSTGGVKRARKILKANHAEYYHDVGRATLELCWAISPKDMFGILVIVFLFSFSTTELARDLHASTRMLLMMKFAGVPWENEIPEDEEYADLGTSAFAHVYLRAARLLFDALKTSPTLPESLRSLIMTKEGRKGYGLRIPGTNFDVWMPEAELVDTRYASHTPSGDDFNVSLARAKLHILRNEHENGPARTDKTLRALFEATYAYEKEYFGNDKVIGSVGLKALPKHLKFETEASEASKIPELLTKAATFTNKIILHGVNESDVGYAEKFLRGEVEQSEDSGNYFKTLDDWKKEKEWPGDIDSHGEEDDG